MKNIIITRKFAVDIDIDHKIFDDFPKIVNFIMDYLRVNSSEFTPYSFEKKSHNAAKALYNCFKKYLNKNNDTIPFDYLERVFRTLFQYVYFNLQNYHRRKNILFELSHLLLSKPWWGVLETQKIKITSVKKVKYFEIDNAKEQYKNLVLKDLKDTPIDFTIKDEFSEFMKIYKPNLENYSKLMRSFKVKLGKYLNRSKKYKNPEAKGWIFDLITVIDKGDWAKDRKNWRTQQNKELNKLKKKQFVKNFIYSDELPDYSTIINRIFDPIEPYGRLTSGSVAGFEEFIKSYLNTQCLQEFANWIAQKYSTKIRDCEKVLASTFSEHYPDALKFPKSTSRSISFGMDDGRIYKINENEHSFKLKAKTQFKKVSIKDPRYYDLINSGWIPQRGVLCLSKGKIILCLPLKKEVPDKLESTLVCGIDLGLKDGMVGSVMETDTDRPFEVKRFFLDQKQLVGKKDEWFLPPTREVKPTNFKSRLFSLRHHAKKYQSQRMNFDHPNKHKTKAYWFIRREEKKRWQQISSIHKEMVNQFATRLVAYCVYYKIGYISFENLKWSTHSLKSKVGPYLAHWQVHWYFSQIQTKTEEIASLHGIKVATINPKNTSQNCHKCGKKGLRKRKTFFCENSTCMWKGDSDLNAARNIALRGIKKYRQYRRYLEKKDKLRKLHACVDGSRGLSNQHPILNKNA